MMDFHILLYLIHLGHTHPLDLWLKDNMQRIEGLSPDVRYNCHKMYII